MINDLNFYEVRRGKLKQYRRMKTVTLTPEQQQYVIENRSTKSIKQISIDLGITFGRLNSNLKIMGLVKRRQTMNEINYLLWHYTV